MNTETPKRLILGFDAGCMTCSDLAQRIEEQMEGKLQVRNLRDLDVMGWRMEALGEDAPWAPTLFEIEDGKTRAWTGWRMGARLSYLLGPSATWRVLRVLGEANGASQGTDTLLTEPATGLTRRQLLKGGFGGAVVGMSILSGTGGFASTAAAAERQPDLNLASTGTPAQQGRAKAIVRSSEQFKKLRRQAPLSFRRSIVRVIGDYALVSMLPNILENENGATSTFANFYVDLSRETVGSYSNLDLTPVSKSKVEARFNQDGQPSGDLTIETDNSGQIVVSTNGQRLSLQQYYQRVSSEQVENAASQDNISTAQIIDSCSDAIGTLCGLGGTVYCVGTCASLAVAGFVPGTIGCSLICGFIAAFGCTGAINRLCPG